MIKLRDYQQYAVDSVLDFFRSGERGNPLIAMPTGTGKSLVIADLARQICAYPGAKMLVVAHTKELVAQNAKQMCRLDPTLDVGINSAGLKNRDIANQIICCGIASIRNHINRFGKIDVMIIDEAHMLNAAKSGMYMQVIGQLTALNPFFRVIGLTATPYRAGQGLLTDPVVVDDVERPGLFSKIVCDMTKLDAFNWFIASGYLSNVVTKKTKFQYDTESLHMRGGEFIEGEMQLAFNRDELTVAAIKEAMSLARDRKSWLVFASGVDHTKRVCELLNLHGISARYVIGDMSQSERDENIRAFKNFEYTALVNNAVLTTGFDHPAVDLLLILRATASVNLWVQIIGRGMRIASGKSDCLCLDFAGNSERIGPVNDPVVPRRRGKGGGMPPVKICPNCDCVNHASVRFCTGLLDDGAKCGHEFTFRTKLQQSASSADLIKGELPITKTFDVTDISYTSHFKAGSPISMKVTYYCKASSYSEYVCFEHEGYARKKAHDWWRARHKSAVPKTTLAALDASAELAAPKQITVWVNKRYPEILGHHF